MVKYIEPRYEKKNSIILDEFDEATEIMFVLKGSVAIGYMFNKKRYISTTKKNGCVVGMFAVMSQVRSQVFY